MSSVVVIEGLIRRSDSREVVRAGGNGCSATPCRTTASLPEPVKKHLPRQAQAIYRAAFNSAWMAYGVRRDRKALAQCVARAAVKKRCRQREQAWPRK